MSGFERMDDEVVRQCMAGSAMRGRSPVLRYGSWRVQFKNRFDPD
jgi:hypothetical protein